MCASHNPGLGAGTPPGIPWDPPSTPRPAQPHGKQKNVQRSLAEGVMGPQPGGGGSLGASHSRRAQGSPQHPGVRELPPRGGEGKYKKRKCINLHVLPQNPQGPASPPAAWGQTHIATPRPRRGEAQAAASGGAVGAAQFWGGGRPPQAAPAPRQQRHNICFLALGGLGAHCCTCPSPTGSGEGGGGEPLPAPQGVLQG